MAGGLSSYAGKRNALWGVGTTFTEEESYDLELVAEQAGLNYRILEGPLYIPKLTTGDEWKFSYEALDGYKRIFHEDSNETFYIGSEGYQIGFQPNELLTFLQAHLAPDGQPLSIEGAGTVFGGRKAFVQIKLDDYRVAGVDLFGLYLMVSVGWDGLTSLRGNSTQIRVVCQNTYNMARGQKDAVIDFRMKHTLNMYDRALNKAKELQLVHKTTLEQMQRLERLAQATATQSDVEQLFELVVPTPEEKATDRQKRQAEKRQKLLWNTYMESPTVDAGTMYGVVNAVTEFIDHIEPRKGQNEDSTNKDAMQRRFVYSIDGEGADRRDLVIKGAEELLSVR